jgi:hypothetical protein
LARSCSYSIFASSLPLVFLKFLQPDDGFCFSVVLDRDVDLIVALDAIDDEPILGPKDAVDAPINLHRDPVVLLTHGRNHALKRLLRMCLLRRRRSAAKSSSMRTPMSVGALAVPMSRDSFSDEIEG